MRLAGGASPSGGKLIGLLQRGCVSPGFPAREQRTLRPLWEGAPRIACGSGAVPIAETDAASRDFARESSRCIQSERLPAGPLLPLVDRRQATQLDQKRRRVIHVLPLALQPSLVRLGLRFANSFPRFGFRVDIRHDRTIRRSQPASLPSPTTSRRPHLSTSPVSQFHSPPTQPDPHGHHVPPEPAATNRFRPAHEPHTSCIKVTISCECLERCETNARPPP